MSKNALLIHYEFCTGCHSCEVACQQEHAYPAGLCGIKVTEYVYPAIKKPVAIDYLPFPTELCDLCINRYQQGEQPACVKHCQSFCMKFGPIEELTKELEARPRSVLFSPR
jgi:Fe-S-cluster-containing dehydrogenase component